jgi:hypothetical protein
MASGSKVGMLGGGKRSLLEKRAKTKKVTNSPRNNPSILEKLFIRLRVAVFMIDSV